MHGLRTSEAVTVRDGEIRWDEKAGLRPDAVCSQVIDALEAPIGWARPDPRRKHAGNGCRQARAAQGARKLVSARSTSRRDAARFSFDPSLTIHLTLTEYDTVIPNHST
jgi:hypothetical protein